MASIIINCGTCGVELVATSERDAEKNGWDHAKKEDGSRWPWMCVACQVRPAKCVTAVPMTATERGAIDAEAADLATMRAAYELFWRLDRAGRIGKEPKEIIKYGLALMDCVLSVEKMHHSPIKPLPYLDGAESYEAL